MIEPDPSLYLPDWMPEAHNLVLELVMATEAQSYEIATQIYHVLAIRSFVQYVRPPFSYIV